MEMDQFLRAVEFHAGRPLDWDERRFMERVYDPDVRDVHAQAFALALPMLPPGVVETVASL